MLLPLCTYKHTNTQTKTQTHRHIQNEFPKVVLYCTVPSHCLLQLKNALLLLLIIALAKGNLIWNKDIIEWQQTAVGWSQILLVLDDHSGNHGDDDNGQDEEEGSVNLVHFTLISLGGGEWDLSLNMIMGWHMTVHCSGDDGIFSHDGEGSHWYHWKAGGWDQTRKETLIELVGLPPGKTFWSSSRWWSWSWWWS